jgi:tetratricopeptide (TPR) repeat protein
VNEPQETPGSAPRTPPPPTLPPTLRSPRLSRVEVEVATTLSAALLYAGRTREATRLCEEMADRCSRAGLARGKSAFLANLAAGQLYLGQRDQASASLARCRQLQPLHGDPLVLSYATMYQARLAIEGGNRGSGRQLLDEAMTIGQSLGSARITAEIWPLVLEAAVQAADPAEAQRAISAYEAGGVQSSNDLWPAVMGRWLWLAGDLPGALHVLSTRRQGHSGELIAAERGRLLLVSGRYDEARAEGEALVERAGKADFVELALRAVCDAHYAPLVQETRGSRWVHLYLGALHLDAIRRQLRGENPTPVLRQLRARASDIGHVLYRSLGREEGW